MQSVIEHATKNYGMFNVDNTKALYLAPGIQAISAW